jgi:hypothetical protein
MRFALRVNKQLVMRGDGSSIAIIYNNLAGLNTPYGDDSPQGLETYRQFMSNELLSRPDAFVPGTLLELVEIPDNVLTSSKIGDPNPDRATSQMTGFGQYGFANLQEGYPEPIATKYSAKDPFSAHHGRVDDYRYSGPLIKTEVYAPSVQYFQVYSEPDHVLLKEFKSPVGSTAFDEACLFAEERGLPWKVAGGAEVFDPATNQLWSL